MNFASQIDNDTLMMVVWFAGAITAIFTAWLTTVKVFKPFFKRVLFWMTTWEQFMKDWAGEEARPGVPAKPGVMERLYRIDHQLHNNNGESVKDSVDRIELRLLDGDQKFDEMSNRISQIESDIRDLKNAKTTRVKKAS